MFTGTEESTAFEHWLAATPPQARAHFCRAAATVQAGLICRAALAAGIAHGRNVARSALAPLLVSRAADAQLSPSDVALALDLHEQECLDALQLRERAVQGLRDPALYVRLGAASALETLLRCVLVLSADGSIQ